MRSKRPLWVLLGALALIGDLFADTQVRFERLSIDDGLSQSVVYTVEQDHLGYMWFGTQDGLNKYDGSSFRVYQHRPFDRQSLADNLVTFVAEDTSNRLWVITSGILNRFVRESEQFVRYVPQNPSQYAPIGAALVFEDRDGRIWVGTQSNGLFLYITKTDQFAHFQIVDGPDFSEFAVTGMVQDDQGYLWVSSSDKGLLRIDVNGGQADTFNEKNSGLTGKGVSNPGGHRSNLVIDSRGQLWVGTLRGLHRFDPKENDFILYQRAPSLPEEKRGICPDKCLLVSISTELATAPDRPRHRS